MESTLGIIITLAIVAGFIVFLFLRSKSGSKNAKNLSNKRKMNNALDTKVRNKFKLFTGLRATEEDQKIYDKVMELCFDEAASFMSDNMTDEQKNAMFEELSKSQSDDDKQKVMANYMSKMKDQHKLNARVDSFLNTLLMDSMKATQN